MNTSWLTFLLIAVGVVIIPCAIILLFMFLKRALPIPEECRKQAGSIKELEKKYWKWDLLGGLFCIIFGFGGGFIGWWVCRALCAWHSADLSGRFVLFPQKGLCLMPSVPAGIALGIVGTWISMRLLLNKKQCAELECYSHVRMGFHVNRFLGYFLSLALVLTMIGMFVPANCYMTLSDHELRYNALFELTEHRYTYADVQRVTQKTLIKSRFKKDIFFCIQFQDGEVWKSGNTQELANAQAKEIAAFVSQQAGVSLEVREKKRR